RAELAKGWIVDVGCNAADFLFGFRSCGFESLLAVEPDEKVQAWNKHYVGCSTHVGMLNTMDGYYDGQCTFVALRDSLEHHLNPAYSISKCFDLLAPGGILFVQVPNMKCQIAIHNLEAFEWFEPDHLFYFDPCSIENLLRQCGFSEIVTETITSPYDEQDHILVSKGEPFSNANRKSIEDKKMGRVLRCFGFKNKAGG
ncbi:MAG: class I SAM-dependent methyltransferase, partial [Leptolyngbyaceae bacterium]|nr:class I SAM-dependent methyltransferase [Leptolyngbyaceae bacterium]